MTTLLMALAAGMAAACVNVTADHISAGEMAQAAAAFGALPAQTLLGNAPALGSRRTYGSAELERLAHRYGLALEPGAEACFIRLPETLTRERVTAALAQALPGAQVDLVDFSRQPVPPGDLRFIPGAGGGREQTWRGTVSSSGQVFPVWARVRLEADGWRVVAAEPLRTGQPIAASQLRRENRPGPSGLPAYEIVGRIPRRPITAGVPIEPQWLADPGEILSGQTVEVEVRSGLARLHLAGLAQAAGKPGQSIPVRNPANGKIFRATVHEHGEVILQAGPPDRPAEVGLP